MAEPWLSQAHVAAVALKLLSAARAAEARGDRASAARDRALAGRLADWIERVMAKGAAQ